MLVPRFSKYIALGLVIGLTSWTSAALIVQDAPPPPDYNFTMKINDGQEIPMYGSVTPVPNGDKWKYQMTGYYDIEGSHVTYSFLIDPDPSLVGSVNVTNTTPTTNNYFFNFSTPVPTFNPSLLSGSVGVTLTNDGSPSATFATVSPKPIYDALINGVSTKTLLNDPHALVVTVPNDTGTETAKFGIPVPDPGGLVTNTIGILVNFSLTSGDGVGVSANFTANPVPEPASMAVLMIGALGLVRRRK